MRLAGHISRVNRILQSKLLAYPHSSRSLGCNRDSGIYAQCCE